MWMQFDQFAKSLLDTLLRPVGTVRSEHEVRSTAQAVDLWFEPAPERSAHRRAVADLAALPRDAWQYQMAMPLLLAHRIKMPPGLYDDSEEDMQYTEELERLYAEWERRASATT